MRTRMSGGVGRVASNGDPYPIYVERRETVPDTNGTVVFGVRVGWSVAGRGCFVRCV